MGHRAREYLKQIKPDEFLIGFLYTSPFVLVFPAELTVYQGANGHIPQEYRYLAGYYPFGPAGIGCAVHVG